MAISRVQFKLNSGSGTSLVVTPDSAPTNGNCMVLVIAYNSGTASRVSSITQTNASWTRAVQSNGTGLSIEVWYSLNASSAGSSLTINLAASLNIAATYVEYSGVATASALDQTATSIDSEVGGGGGGGD